MLPRVVIISLTPFTSVLCDDTAPGVVLDLTWLSNRPVCLAFSNCRLTLHSIAAFRDVRDDGSSG